ncbi:hypothetical protein [Streptomyces xiaopingdaonensis]|uniref:hypothetical protein n=1 Tax=Streptomyces xiaopingdaonensis TaxID=1565415 RepID=UPI0002FA31F7|nr:hypothetical protein [Streptomyces xiaopingdaonensis]
MRSGAPYKRSRRRRLGENVYGMLLLAKTLLMVVVAAVLLVAGVWSSWGSAYPAMAGEERGTVRVTDCGDDECTGRFSADTGSTPAEVTLGQAVSGSPGETFDAALRPGERHAVRADAGGILYSWAPLGGALLLASIVVVGGLRMRRLGVGLGLLGAALLGGAWALLTF